MKKFLGHIRGARAAFTLMEVNLAIFIMAVGVLAMTSLYPLGFRESQQSRDDVRAAVAADEVLGRLTAALSSRNIKWRDWKSSIQNAINTSKNGDQGGWLAYFKKRGTDAYFPVTMNEANSRAKRVFDALARTCSGATSVPTWSPDSKYAHGLVVQWGKRIVGGIAHEDHSRVSISFRLSRRSGSLMTAPLYYTEIHFQGDQEEMEQ